MFNFHVESNFKIFFCFFKLKLKFFTFWRQLFRKEKEKQTPRNDKADDYYEQEFLNLTKGGNNGPIVGMLNFCLFFFFEFYSSSCVLYVLENYAGKFFQHSLFFFKTNQCFLTFEIEFTLKFTSFFFFKYFYFVASKPKAGNPVPNKGV